MRRLAAAATLAVALAAPAHAQTASPVQALTLAYETGAQRGKPVLWAANPFDGSGAHVLARGGQYPQVSPNGTTVAYVTGFEHAQLRVISSLGGSPRTLARNVWYADAIRWSPDGSTLSVITGRELGPYTLKLVDVASGTARAVATGTFYGVSFAPDGSGVVWARAAKDAYPSRADLYATDLAGGPVRRLTTDRNALSPVWGPQAIVYSRQHRPVKKGDAYKLDLYTIAPDGTGRTRLTTTHPKFLLAGLTATAWSADGTRLLAEFGGQDTSEAWRVDPATGAAEDVTGTFDAVSGSALSTDGTTILGHSGSFDDPRGNVVAIDYASGHVTVLARHAIWPSWSR